MLSLSQTSEMQEDPLPLTNGHTHLVNGALNPEELSPVTDKPSVDRDKSSEEKPQSSPGQSQTKPDPYEFPHSPPKQSEQRLPPPPPTYQEALKATESHALLKQLQPPCQVDSNPEQTSPLRLNGGHHSFSSDSTNVTAKLDPPTEKSSSSSSSSSSSKSSAQLLAQTGGLISEYYSHSRLHQISTWRTGFSEYVNELHSKRKAAGTTSFPGKERLRKSVAQQSADSRGRKGKERKEKVTLMLLFIYLSLCNGLSRWLSGPHHVTATSQVQVI